MWSRELAPPGLDFGLGWRSVGVGFDVNGDGENGEEDDTDDEVDLGDGSFDDDDECVDVLSDSETGVSFAVCNGGTIGARVHSHFLCFLVTAGVATDIESVSSFDGTGSAIDIDFGAGTVAVLIEGAFSLRRGVRS